MALQTAETSSGDDDQSGGATQYLRRASPMIWEATRHTLGCKPLRSGNSMMPESAEERARGSLWERTLTAKLTAI